MIAYKVLLLLQVTSHTCNNIINKVKAQYALCGILLQVYLVHLKLTNMQLTFMNEIL